jgi:hypothetical protein
MLYVNGMSMMMAAGGAERESRARRLTKEARRAAGRCLGVEVSGETVVRDDARRAEEELRHAEEAGAMLEV